MGPIYKPTKGPEDWKEFLGDPELHWKTGYSARSLAYSWEESGGLPAEIREVLELAFGSPVEPLIVIPEYKVPMPGSATGASQNDVFLLCRTNDGTAVVMIEGKVNESFDKTVREWLGPTPSSAKQARIEVLCAMMGGSLLECLDLRYQLFHRCASAILEAKRFNASYAVMLVHSFSQQKRWYEDFTSFSEAIGAETTVGDVRVADLPSGPLHIGWVTGDPQFLSR